MDQSGIILKIANSFKKQITKELQFGLKKVDTYKKFSKRVAQSKYKLKEIFINLKNNNKKVIGYGATAKSTTVLNYCGIDREFIDYFLDTTPDKQNKYTPGTKIKIKKYDNGIKKDIDYAFLGAWNFKNEIFLKERKFIKRGGKFITHVPYPKII